MDDESYYWRQGTVPREGGMVLLLLPAYRFGGKRSSRPCPISRLTPVQTQRFTLVRGEGGEMIALLVSQ